MKRYRVVIGPRLAQQRSATEDSTKNLAKGLNDPHQPVLCTHICGGGCSWAVVHDRWRVLPNFLKVTTLGLTGRSVAELAEPPALCDQAGTKLNRARALCVWCL